MNKKKGFATLLILSLAAFFLLTACQSAIPVQAKAIEVDASKDTTSSEFDYEKAADNQANRWIAMARAYEKAGLLNHKTDPSDLTAYRWNAMARFYEQHDLLTNKMDAGDIKAFRWLAMAREYERLGLLNDK